MAFIVRRSPFTVGRSALSGSNFLSVYDTGIGKAENSE
jgi:hypothetical protein